MLRCTSYDVVFAEVPGEVTLALNISGCPNRCPACHSPHLQEETGEVLDENVLAGLLEKYGAAITCVCLMGGDGDVKEVAELAAFVRAYKETRTDGRLKTCWYSGREYLPEGLTIENFDYIKLGPYMEKSGALDSPSTNQRFYRIDSGQMTDITYLFHKKPFR